jgi:hypothetical protein
VRKFPKKDWGEFDKKPNFTPKFWITTPGCILWGDDYYLTIQILFKILF